MSANPVRSNCARPHRCSLDTRLAAMARSPLTRDLTPEQHRAFDHHVSSWSWGVDDPIQVAGEEVDGSYLLVAGRARITRDTADGRQITVDIAAPGDIIGPLQTHSARAADSAWAMETTCGLFLPAAALGSVVTDYPAVGLAIIRLQQERLAQGRNREIAQATATVEERVAATLSHLDRKLGQTRRDGSRLLQVRLRRDDIAGMSGTTVESASRVLARMKKSGVIDSGREWTAITDHDALETLVPRS